MKLDITATIYKVLCLRVYMRATSTQTICVCRLRLYQSVEKIITRQLTLECKHRGDRGHKGSAKRRYNELFTVTDLADHTC